MESPSKDQDIQYDKIIHVDMDAFFASIEQRDHPEWRDKPLVVGSADRRGVIAAASYEARKFGVRSAMPSAVAIKLCPQLIFAPHRFSVYKEVSGQIHGIFKQYTNLIEPLSLDEAYLDVTSNKPGIALATEIAREIRQKIYEETALTASAGISYNKFLAKMASDINKPNGQKLIHPSQAIEFLEELEVSRFYGVGKVTAQKMEKAGIHYGRDLKKYSEEALEYLFGKQGAYYFQIVRGVDSRRVKAERGRKSVSAESTMREDLLGESEMFQVLEKISRELSRRMEKGNYKGRTITVKLKYFDFEQHTRSKTLPNAISDEESILKLASELLFDPMPEKPIRLLGIGLSNLGEDIIESDDQLTIGF